ncbi:glycosyltransferase involved in cell wall biosynthesis [Friedmanniella endophytica]|uniref:Glycosyltransferase involved in cell wall biosynthesis n=1 Tax=Microlunatus kandeliicorticis TaxID=1759536 RepID=A0A7W3IP70_9ACTN|nr:glycosyltransferase family 4 protein [Microlunatus kandeliicorticis]MBA8792699.1 glycosyltransferase involved in cell wall biosynthesis [Microlunatus kandeliicorticis]
MIKLLLIAPTCDGEDVGEAWVAYQWASRLARRTDLTVLTYHKRGRRPLSDQLTGARVVEWSEPPLLGRAERLNSIMKPGYLPFYVESRRWIRARLAAGEHFDCGHQPVPVAMRYPSPMAGLGIPWVLGPVGGGLQSPPGFAGAEQGAPWFMNLRRLDRFRMSLDRTLRSTYQDADCVLGIADYVADLLEPLTLKRFEVLSETALTELPDGPGPAPVAVGTESGGPLSLLFVGRLVRTKGPHEAIRSMARLRDLDVRLDLVGDGPCRSELEQLVEALALGDRVTLHGSLPRTEVERFYRAADVFVFPSYREPGGNVPYEAMGHGLPLIVTDRGGPASSTDASCAIRLPAIDPDQLTTAVAEAVRHLHDRPELRREMSAAALRRVRGSGLWSAKIDRIEDLYREVIGRGASA